MLVRSSPWQKGLLVVLYCQGFWLFTSRLQTSLHLVPPAPRRTLAAQAGWTAIRRLLGPPRHGSSPSGVGAGRQRSDMDNELTTLGIREKGGYPQLFGISAADRLQHMLIIGKSGTGKTTLARNMAVHDIEHFRGVAFVDPHGDEAERLLDEVPRGRADHLVYFDAADQGHPPGLNLLEAVDPADRPLVVASIVAIFKALWADSWGPRLEYILANSIATLLEVPAKKGGATLLGIPRLLTSEGYRAWVLSFVRDPRVLSFWQVEFEGWGERLQAEATSPVLNKTGRLLLSPVLRNILGQVT